MKTWSGDGSWLETINAPKCQENLIQHLHLASYLLYDQVNLTYHISGHGQSLSMNTYAPHLLTKWHAEVGMAAGNHVASCVLKQQAKAKSLQVSVAPHISARGPREEAGAVCASRRARSLTKVAASMLQRPPGSNTTSFHLLDCRSSGYVRSERMQVRPRQCVHHRTPAHSASPLAVTERRILPVA